MVRFSFNSTQRHELAAVADKYKSKCLGGHMLIHSYMAVVIIIKPVESKWQISYPRDDHLSFNG